MMLELGCDTSLVCQDGSLNLHRSPRGMIDIQSARVETVQHYIVYVLRMTMSRSSSNTLICLIIVGMKSDQRRFNIMLSCNLYPIGSVRFIPRLF